MADMQHSSYLDNILIQTCDIYYWDKSAEIWKTDDGNWYSLSRVNVKALQKTIETLTQVSRTGMERQCIIAEHGLGFIKNILCNPSPDPLDSLITLFTWELMLSLVLENQKNRSKVWNECSEFFLSHLQQTEQDSDSCRLVVYNIFGLGGLGKNEGTKILKILLQSFHREKKNTPLKEQGLTCFLDHFITREKSITNMYLELNKIEKMALLHFTVDYVCRSPVDGFKHSPVPLYLLYTICNDFGTKNEQILQSSVVEDTEFQELLALFEVIAHFSNDQSYKMNRFHFGLLFNVGRLISYVRDNDDMAERTFWDNKRNSNVTLKQVILTTISNLVKDNNDHKEKARDSGLIEGLVDFVAAKGTDRAMYSYTIFALIDICQTNPRNMEYAGEIVNKKDLTKSAVFEHFLFDLTYKGRRCDL